MDDLSGESRGDEYMVDIEDSDDHESMSDDELEASEVERREAEGGWKLNADVL